MPNLMERGSGLMLPHSLSDADLASSFSDILLEKITRTKRDQNLDIRHCFFTVVFDAHQREDGVNIYRKCTKL